MGKRLELLIVEDDKAICGLMRKYLVHMNLTATFAAGTLTALEAMEADAERFDVLVVDPGMPDFSGMFVLEAAKRYRSGLSVVLMSGSSNPLGPLPSPDFAFLAKPFSAKELLDAVQLAVLLSEAEPTGPAPGTPIEEDERRHCARLPAGAHASLATVDDRDRLLTNNNARLSDVSGGGIGLYSSVAVPVRSEAVLHLQTLSVYGTVVRCERKGSEYSVGMTVGTIIKRRTNSTSRRRPSPFERQLLEARTTA